MPAVSAQLPLQIVVWKSTRNSSLRALLLLSSHVNTGVILSSNLTILVSVAQRLHNVFKLKNAVREPACAEEQLLTHGNTRLLEITFLTQLTFLARTS